MFAYAVTEYLKMWAWLLAIFALVFFFVWGTARAHEGKYVCPVAARKAKAEALELLARAKELGGTKEAKKLAYEAELLAIVADSEMLLAEAAGRKAEVEARELVHTAL